MRRCGRRATTVAPRRERRAVASRQSPGTAVNIGALFELVFYFKYECFPKIYRRRPDSQRRQMCEVYFCKPSL